MLIAKCKRFLVGSGYTSPAKVFEEMAAYCREHEVEADTYGEGAVIKGFEDELAALLGQQAAVFMPSGTMAGQIAARVWCDLEGRRGLAMHPTCHLELHERHGYAWLHDLKPLLIGDRQQPLTAQSLEGCAERPGVLVVELPFREIGGVLPSWEELVALKSSAKARGVRLHLDGARLWETTPFYGKSLAEIAGGFDSVYVSLYKTIGNLSGAVLAGPRDFVSEARVWLRRHGGNLFQLLPYVVSARIRLGQRLPRIPHYVEHARRVAAVLRTLPGVSIRPEVPHVNMFHAFVERPAAALRVARDRIATEDEVWLFGRAADAERPGTSVIELSIGEGAAALSDADIKRLFLKALAD